MIVLMKLRHDIIRITPIVLLGFAFAWCGFYLLFGSASIFSYQSLKLQEEQLAAHLEEIQTKRAAIEDKVIRMRPDTLDWDLVEEQAYAKLGTPKDAAKALNM